MLKVDTVVADVISDVGKKNNITSESVLKIVDSYFQGVKKLIEEDKSNVIKLDFFGKLIHNQAWKEKVKLSKKLKQERETTKDNEVIRD